MLPLQAEGLIAWGLSETDPGVCTINGSCTYTPNNGVVTLTLAGNALFVKGSVSAVSTSTAGVVFSSGFEPADTQPTWSNTLDESAGISNVRGVCCNLPGPEAKIGAGSSFAHTGDHALLYSGYASNPNGTDYAYSKIFDVSSRNIVIHSSSTLSYWINPESAATSYNYATGSNSTCVGVDLIFSDGSTLRDSGAVDQNGHRAHPFYGQCNHLTLDAWNQVRVNLGSSSLNGKTLLRVIIGYDQPGVTGGYRGAIDDISITG
ncbi:hypothetical protein [Dictyobacter alpinus]|nr:hypothetical protein [Dictyobacter alpinus]